MSEPVGVIGEELVRRAVAAFVADALSAAHVRDVMKEGVSQLRDLAAHLPDGLAFTASRWLDKADAVAGSDWLAPEISIRLGRLLAPLLRAGAGEGADPAPARLSDSPATLGSELVEELRELDG